MLYQKMSSWWLTKHGHLVHHLSVISVASAKKPRGSFQITVIKKFLAAAFRESAES
uniref:Uncharacterized protein n=1 Tax=Parascaris univalens TaxID=6257 RepID=A0A915A2X7_PARUN